MKKKLPKDAQHALLMEIVKTFDGPLGLSRYVTEKTEHYIHSPSISNYRQWGYVPLKHCFIMAKALRISPYLLNYKGISKFYHKSEDWEDLLKGVKFLTTDQTKHILRFKIPKEENGNQSLSYV